VQTGLRLNLALAGIRLSHRKGWIMQENDDMPEHRTDDQTAAIIAQAQRLCVTDGIGSAIRYLESRRVDRATILRVLCSPKFHR
jgi:hypothetical protein